MTQINFLAALGHSDGSFGEASEAHKKDFVRSQATHNGFEMGNSPERSLFGALSMGMD